MCRRVRSGRLHPVHRGVYLVGHEIPPANAREMAALLACGPAAAVSDRSAAAVWDDVLWRSLAFGIEIDGYDGHGGRVAFERDRLKVATLKAHGLSVMLITPGKLRDDPKAVLARLLSALALAGYRR